MIEFKWYRFSWEILFLAIIWFPLGFRLHESWGWENGFLENAQLVILFLCAVAAWAVSKQYPRHSDIRGLWRWTLPIWGLLILRELSWGRCFYRISPDGVSPEFLPGKELWFNPIVDPIIAVTCIVMIVGFVRHFNFSEIRKYIRFNAFYVAMFVILATMVSIIENGDLAIFSQHGTVLEELGETIAYLCLLSNIRIHLPKARESLKKHDKSVITD